MATATLPSSPSFPQFLITSQEISRYAELTSLISQLEAQQKTLRAELLACFDELVLQLRRDCGLRAPKIEQLFERATVRHVLDATHGNISRAAQLLGKHRNGLAREMKRFGFSIHQWDRRGSRGARKQEVYQAFAATSARPPARELTT